MKKALIKIIYAMIIFVAAILLTDRIMNKGNTDNTTEMSQASFPVVYIEKNDEQINCLHGYSQEMDTRYQCETVTPVERSDRKINIKIDTFDNQISGISYEVRSVDGERLVEDSKVSQYVQSENKIPLEITLKDLLEMNTEYSLCLKVVNMDGRIFYYYTRIILADTAYHVDEEVQFALDFHSRTFDKERAQEITKYLESNNEGDNTSYSHVNIHSSFSQITWGDLNIKKEMDPIVYIRQCNPYVSRIELRYIVSMQDGINTSYYNIREYYFIRYGKERMYLLDYERTMNSIFNHSESIFTNNKISLGITDESIQMKESEDGHIFAFVKEGRLFSLNITDNKLALLFGFYDEKNADERTLYNNSSIHIINVDETGNVRFLVSGYMNRGTHEGGVGVTCYYYNSMLNTIEEEIYIPCTTSAGLMERNIDQLAYVNNNNQLFLVINGSIYKIDLIGKTYEILKENLAYGSYKVSESNRMIVWQDGTNQNASTMLNLLNLNTGNQSQIQAGNGKFIKPLGFMNEDLIYGTAYSSDIGRDDFGTTIFPMFDVVIQDESGNTLKNYRKEGIYVTDINIVDNQINLKRVRKMEDTGSYIESEDDQILNDVAAESAKNTIEVVPTQDYEKIVQIAAKSNFKVSSIKYLTPKQVIYEGERELHLPESEEENQLYYVYDKYGINKVLLNPSDAIILADQVSGKVLNDKGAYVWEKNNRSTINQIMSITEDKVSEDRGSVAVCLDTILKLQGSSRNSAQLLADGNTLFMILQNNLIDEEVLDLSGCSLESVLYYVGKDIPVMARLNDGNAVLIVGYNELNTVIFNPMTGTISKMGLNDSISYFQANGNNFITYIPK